MSKMKLSEFITDYGDGIHGTPEYSEYGDYYFINGNNLDNGSIIISDDVLKIDDQEYERIKRPLGERTVLLSINGSLGKTAFYHGEKVALGKSACYINIKNEYSKEFFRYVLTTKEFQKYMLQVAHGSTIKNFAPSQVGEYEVELPAKEEHELIAMFLTKLDNKIANNNTICSTLESMAKLIYDYWFVQFDFPDENGKPYKSSGGKMVWNEELKREIPEGWEVKYASDLTTVRTGKEDANFASNDGKFAYFTCGKDVLKCNVPAFEGRAVLLAGNGDFNVKHFTGKFNAYQRTYVLIPNDEKYYALLYMVTKEAIERFTKGSAGSIVKFITLGDVNGIILLDPHDDIMLEKFNLIIDKIEQIQAENQQLASLRDFLLPMLMNGQVKVGKEGS